MKFLLSIFLSFILFLIIVGGIDYTTKDISLYIVLSKFSDQTDIHIYYTSYNKKYYINKQNILNNVIDINFNTNKIENISVYVNNGVIDEIKFINTSSSLTNYKIKNSNSFELQNIELYGKKSIKNFEILYFSFIIIFFTSFYIFMQIGNVKLDANLVESNYFKNIDFLRFLFAIFIILYHLNIIPSGFISIEYFFMISGFCLFKTLENIENISQKDFIIKRYIRLFPLYLLILFIRDPINFIKYNMLQCIFGLDIVFKRINNPFFYLWFIPIIFWSGIFIFLLFKNFKKQAKFLLGIIIYLSLLCIYSSYGYIGVLPLNVNGIFYLMRGVAFVGLGYFIYIFHKNLKLPININVYFITFLEILFLFLIIKCSLITNCNSLLIVLYGAVLLYLFAEKKGILSQSLDNNFSVLVGKYSFALYVCHEVLTTNYIDKNTKMLKVIEFLDLKDVYLIKFYIIICSILFAIFLYHFFEKPVGDFLIKKYNESKDKI